MILKESLKHDSKYESKQKYPFGPSEQQIKQFPAENDDDPEISNE